MGVGSLSLLQGIFPTQGPNLGLPHCRWILYQLSHKGSPTGLCLNILNVKFSEKPEAYQGEVTLRPAGSTQFYLPNDSGSPFEIDFVPHYALSTRDMALLRVGAK